jgi:hypothetical protein
VDDFKLSSSELEFGEAPVISVWILDSLRDRQDSCLVLWETFNTVSFALQLQVRLLTASTNLHPSVSPLLLITIFRFFAAIISRYVDSHPEYYSGDHLMLYPFLQTAFHGKKWYMLVE